MFRPKSVCRLWFLQFAPLSYMRTFEIDTILRYWMARKSKALSGVLIVCCLDTYSIVVCKFRHALFIIRISFGERWNSCTFFESWSFWLVRLMVHTISSAEVWGHFWQCRINDLFNSQCSALIKYAAPCVTRFFFNMAACMPNLLSHCVAFSRHSWSNFCVHPLSWFNWNVNQSTSKQYIFGICISLVHSIWILFFGVSQNK